MRFRETLWFKKGLQADAQHVDDQQDVGQEVPEFELPIEDRYNDDGNISPSDTAQFGVHTGTTQAMRTVHRADHGNTVDERVLIREMKRRSWLRRG